MPLNTMQEITCLICVTWLSALRPSRTKLSVFGERSMVLLILRMLLQCMMIWCIV